MNNRCVVLGDSGFLGRHFVRFLVDRGYRVTGCARSHDACGEKGYKHVVGSVADGSFLRSFLCEGDIVFDMTNSGKPADADHDKQSFFDACVANTMSVGEICREVKVAKLINISTAGEMYGNVTSAACEEQVYPISAYGYGKFVIERVLRQILMNSDIKLIIARVSNPFGNHNAKTHGFVDVAINKAISGTVLSIWGTDEITRDYIYIGDVMTALETFIEQDPHYDAYNICSGVYYSLREVIHLINKYISPRILESELIPRKTDGVVVSMPSPVRFMKEFTWRPELSLESYIKASLQQENP